MSFKYCTIKTTPHNVKLRHFWPFLTNCPTMTSLTRICSKIVLLKDISCLFMKAHWWCVVWLANNNCSPCISLADSLGFMLFCVKHVDTCPVCHYLQNAKWRRYDLLQGKHDLVRKSTDIWHQTLYQEGKLSETGTNMR